MTKGYHSSASLRRPADFRIMTGMAKNKTSAWKSIFVAIVVLALLIGMIGTSLFI